LLLPNEPLNAISLTDAKKQLETEGQAVLVGRIGSGSLSPFEKGQGVFAISEAPASHGDEPSHNASECPFCKRRAEDAPIATIELCDREGAIVPFGADKLLGLESGQTIVVQGRGLYDLETDTIKIKSNGVFVRKK